MTNTMKHSGIPWIGDIPNHWEVEILKFIFEERNERSVYGEEMLLSLSQYTGVKPKAETDIADSHIAESYEGYKIVREGDFVMNIMLAWNGSYAVSNYDGMISPAYCVFKFRNDKYYKRYYHYLLRTEGYPSAFKTLSRGIMESRLRLYPEQFYTFPTIVPPLTEQKAIADYLDKHCAEVDEMVSLQEKIIEELRAYRQAIITETVTHGLNPNAKMKDSGVEWIGQIPEGWEVKRLKNIISSPLQYGANESGDMYNPRLPRYVRITDIIDNRLKEDIEKQSLTEEQANGYILQHNDILLARSGGTVGKAFIYKQEYGRCAYAGYLIRAQVKKRVDADYIFYFTQTSCYEEWKKQIFIQSTIQNIGADRYNELLISIPPLHEQQEIADYLDKKTVKIDQLIAIKKQTIEELKEYKKSLIYEYVTGKKQPIL